MKIIKNKIDSWLDELTYEATMSADDGVYNYESFILYADIKLRFRILALILGKERFNRLLGIGYKR